MTPQERQALIIGWMRERIEQGYGALEAHSYALHQLAIMEEHQAEAQRAERRLNRRAKASSHDVRNALRDLEKAKRKHP
jgi:light-regulated signal transduction histidine kinase (bacteriophytochrome)